MKSILQSLLRMTELKHDIQNLLVIVQFKLYFEQQSHLNYFYCFYWNWSLVHWTLFRLTIPWLYWVNLASFWAIILKPAVGVTFVFGALKVLFCLFEVTFTFTYQLKEYIGSFLEMNKFDHQMSGSVDRQTRSILLARFCLKINLTVCCD